MRHPTGRRYNNLLLKASKTKKLIMDLSRERGGAHAPIQMGSLLNVSSALSSWDPNLGESDYLQPYSMPKQTLCLFLPLCEWEESSFFLWSMYPLLIHRGWYDTGPPFATMTDSTLLGRFCIRFSSVFMGISDHSSRSRFVRSDTDVGLHLSIWLRSVFCAGQSSFSTPDLLIHVFMDLASCWNRKEPSPNCSYNVGAWDCPKSLDMLWKPA